jgi:hypothetical protein
MNPLTDWRAALAARLGAATGLEAWSYPPPSIVPPCVVVLPGVDYVTGRRTGCQLAAQVTVRLVTDVHESSGAFEHVDELICAALEALPSFTAVTVAADTYGNARYWCADITVTDSVPFDPLTPAALLARRTHA